MHDILKSQKRKDKIPKQQADAKVKERTRTYVRPEKGSRRHCTDRFLQTISEIALTGYVGTEIGCQFPRDPAILNKELGRRDLSVITAWISTYLNEQPLWWNERAFVDHMNFLKACGTNIINTSDQSFSIQHQWNTPLSQKKVLNDDEFETLASSYDNNRSENQRNRSSDAADRPEVCQPDL